MLIDHTTHHQLERRISDIDLGQYIARRYQTHPEQPYTPSPRLWQDQVLYFVLLDRFSDARERGTDLDAIGIVRDAYLDNDGQRVSAGTTPRFVFPDDASIADRSSWAAAGGTWCGGTLNGLKSKLGYLKRLGVTAIWVSPVFKQVARTFDPYPATTVDTNSYHGYGIQNFIDVDPHFGTRQDLVDLVDEAHRLGIYVILDIIFNHTGDVFEYAADRYTVSIDNQPLGAGADQRLIMDPRWDDGTYLARGYRSAAGEATVPFGPVDPATNPDPWPDAAVWPAELQPASAFTLKGRIANWDYYPEYIEGDFETLKNIRLGEQDLDAEGRPIVDRFRPSPALNALCDAYKFWIAFADVDGFRIDTVKHMELGATRYFVSVIHEFAQSLGKERFFLLGEVAGSRASAISTVAVTGLDAGLGIADVADQLEYLPKGYRDPETYFGLFANSAEIGMSSHVWLGEKVVTMFDDHDKIGRPKRRFAGDRANHGYELLVPALALNLTTLGIPCIYYGSEQGFDGDGDNDRFLRECMFGGPFGSLQSTNRHFFDEQHAIYRRVAEICELRRQFVHLRRGRQYLRQISESGEEGTFGFPRQIGGQMRSVVPWSRLFVNHELLLAINTDPDSSRTAWVTIDGHLHQPGETLTCRYSTDAARIGTTVTVAGRNGRAIQLTVPPAGFVVYD